MTTMGLRAAREPRRSSREKEIGTAMACGKELAKTPLVDARKSWRSPGSNE